MGLVSERQRDKTFGLKLDVCLTLGIGFFLGARYADCTYVEADLARMLDVMVMDAIPGPEHIAMANSITFSVAVSEAVGLAVERSPGSVWADKDRRWGERWVRSSLGMSLVFWPPRRGVIGTCAD
jgi:hypothetical protein